MHFSVILHWFVRFIMFPIISYSRCCVSVTLMRTFFVQPVVKRVLNTPRIALNNLGRWHHWNACTREVINRCERDTPSGFFFCLCVCVELLKAVSFKRKKISWKLNLLINHVKWICKEMHAPWFMAHLLRDLSRAASASTAIHFLSACST